MNPECAVAAFYYKLYMSSSNQQTEPEQQVSVWEEDEWTDEDVASAQAVLHQSQDKARVVSMPSLDSSLAWNRFYEAHQTKFFKDRHYLVTAFPNEFGFDSTSSPKCLVEVGCGVGNALLPLLGDEKWTVYGMDLSEVAINLLQQDPRFLLAANEARASAYCCDVTQEIPESCIGVANVTTLLFCLSAIDPELHSVAARHVTQTLAPGGVLVVRDYGRYDEAQLKLGSQRNKLLKDNFYRKHDDTRCFYFATEDLARLFDGLHILELHYIRRAYRNRLTQSSRRRVWVQARFQKPES